MCEFKILCEISKVPFEISRKILNPYTAKYAFYEVLKIWRLTIYQSYDILSLSETGLRCVKSCCHMMTCCACRSVLSCIRKICLYHVEFVVLCPMDTNMWFRPTIEIIRVTLDVFVKWQRKGIIIFILGEPLVKRDPEEKADILYII